MDYQQAKQVKDQLYLYTQDIYKHLGVKFQQSSKNSYGKFASNMPCGAIMHYTASNSSYDPVKRPYDRLPILLPRFARGSGQGVGVQFIILDKLIPRFEQYRSKYPMLNDMKAEVIFLGDDLTFWHAGWANSWAYGIEFRNIGRIQKKDDDYFWNDGKLSYVGRTPIKVGSGYWEPYTRAQMATGLWVNRVMCACHPILPHRFLMHTHVSNTRIDAGPHFPIHEMRSYSLEPGKVEVELDQVPFLQEFQDDQEDSLKRSDFHVSEKSLHKGLYRHDWDGVPEWANGYPLLGPKDTEDALGSTATRENYIRQLRSVGYYADDTCLNDVVAVFRSRWKERKGKKWVSMLTPHGGMDQQALLLLSMMVRQWGSL
jgi:hypothetical protein